MFKVTKQLSSQCFYYSLGYQVAAPEYEWSTYHLRRVDKTNFREKSYLRSNANYITNNARFDLKNQVVLLIINSFWSGDATWSCRTLTSLAQVMFCSSSEEKLTYCQVDQQEQVSVKWEYNIFYSWKCIWIGKCRPFCSGFNISIVLFHNEFSPSGEQPEQHNLPHKL